MPVALQPGFQPVPVGPFAKAAHIIVGHTVCHQTAEVPQESVALVHASDHNTLQDREIRDWIIPICLLEHFRHIVRPVLASGLVAVFHHHLPGAAVLRGNAANQFSHKSFVVTGQIRFAHLVHFQARSFRNSGGIGDAGALHITGQHRPLPFRHLPDQLSILQPGSQVHHGRRIHAQLGGIGFGRGFPHIVTPQRKRLLVHPGQGFVGIAVHGRSLRQGKDKGIFRRVLHHQLKSLCLLCREGQQVRSQRLEPGIGIVVVAVVFKREHLFPIGLQVRLRPTGSRSLKG